MLFNILKMATMLWANYQGRIGCLTTQDPRVNHHFYVACYWVRRVMYLVENLDILAPNILKR